ncbi:hypothetical protein PILCRDRAFT_3807 [Piloderma croceum F 1598]|uniref:C2H2-type domain-containing protein n=1 Tax=Piloderma croceum (strain F 1598) TaxID=765440 RepID=A0A0C3G684_PILCF|nr:hypothetical protein PILCRDRAFT_3807 [Piloderma croceum F 1598]
MDKIKCSHCARNSFGSRKALEAHIFKTHENVCGICDCILQSRTTFLQHAASQHGRHYCDGCQKRFQSKKDLEKHVAKKHPHEAFESTLPVEQTPSSTEAPLNVDARGGTFNAIGRDQINYIIVPLSRNGEDASFAGLLTQLYNDSSSSHLHDSI